MVHGAPDWGVFESLSTVYRVTDLGELAARINVVNTYDRRGNVIWWDDFEDNLNKWIQITTGAGAAVALSTDTARSGGKSAQLTTGNVVNNTTRIYRNMGLPPLSSKLGVEMSFAASAALMVQLGLILYSGTHLIIAGLFYDYTAQTLQYYNSVGGTTTLDASLNLALATTWHTMKLVGDISGTGEYVRALVDDQSYDMSGIAPQATAIVSAGYMDIQLSAQALAAANRSLYIDDVIITQNEP